MFLALPVCSNVPRRDGSATGAKQYTRPIVLYVRQFFFGADVATSLIEA